MANDPNSLSQSLAAHDVSRASNSYNIEKLGNYKIIKKLGEGGMGAVFLAEDVIAQRPVALKVLPLDKVDHPNAVSRFRREAKAIGKLSHPNIIQAYALGEEQGFHFYAMERCEGQPLDKILEAKERLPIKEALDYAIQAARGLEHAHAHGIIHRDIKPGNLFITNEGVLKILDLGLSKNISSDMEQSFVTGTGTILGTPYYISPEQALGKAEIDGRTDIYSLGATLYHLLTGHTPYSGNTAAVIVSKHLVEKLRNPHDLNPEIPENLVRVIERMMAKAPEDRYANCSDLLEDLEAVASGTALSSTAIDAELTSILPRSTVADAVDAAAPAPRTGGALASFARRTGLPVQALILSASAAFALLVVALLLARGLAGKAAASQPAALTNTSAKKPPDDSAPQWTNPDEPPAASIDDSAPGPKPAADLPPRALQPEAIKSALVTTVDKEGYQDLLPAVEPKQARGTWKVEHGTLSTSNSDHAALSVPVELPKAYDVRFEFSSTGEFALMLPCDGATVVWMISGRPCGSIIGCPGERRPQWVALHSFDTTRRHKGLAEVRPEYVRIFVDDFHEPLQEWKATRTNGHPQTIPWFDGDQTKLTLGSNRGNATVYSLKLKDGGKQ